MSLANSVFDKKMMVNSSVIEIIFKKHQRRKNKKDSVAKTAVRKWKGNVEVKKTKNLMYLFIFPILKLNAKVAFTF